MRCRTTSVVVGLGLLLTACGDAATPKSSERAAGPTVVAAFYPLEHVVRAVGGDRVTVENLTPPGAEPHDLELGARQTARVQDAHLLVHLAGFQPAVDEVAEAKGDGALDAMRVVKTLQASGADAHAEEEGAHAEEETGGADPHVWLDPLRLAEIGDAVADRLAQADAEGAEAYRAGAAALRSDLEALDREYTAGLERCRRREVVVSHNAFAYLADRYDLEQVGISGLSPEEEPTPARVAEAAEFAREHGVTTIFFETLVSPAVAQTVAREVGAKTAVLDPLEGRPDGGDYLTGMRANLEALRAALGCT